MVKAYEKGSDIVLSKEFELIDFDCKCERPDCVSTLVDDVLVEGLTQLALVFPLIIVDSGFRCDAHNKEVGGSPTSFHKSGKAADIRSPFATPAMILKEANAIKCFEQGGAGLYNSFIHLDVRGARARWDFTNPFGGK